jgi:hypothetical protein
MYDNLSAVSHVVEERSNAQGVGPLMIRVGDGATLKAVFIRMSGIGMKLRQAL